jgi:hypothetical protein
MKRFTLITACALSFVGGTIVHLPRSNAQTAPATQKRLYYLVDYMKSRQGMDAYKLEHDTWGPIHKELISTGQIASWSMMLPQFGGALNYDYVTVEGYHSLAEIENLNTNYQTIFDKVWGKDKTDAMMKETDKTRDMVGSQIFLVVDSAEPPPK